jgi:hypothetical protein
MSKLFQYLEHASRAFTRIESSRLISEFHLKPVRRGTKHFGASLFNGRIDPGDD